MTESSVRRFCTFFLGDECYGVDILTVREINRHVVLTPARGGASCVRGFMNLRGQIVTVIDASIRLGGKPCEIGPKTRLVILKTNAELLTVGTGELKTGDEWVGLLVDRISDVVSAEEDQIDPPPPDRSHGDHLIQAIVQLKDDMIRVVDPAAMLRLSEAD